MEKFTVQLPVKPYIKKYLTNLYGDPILLDFSSNIGFIILTSLTSTLDSKLFSYYGFRGDLKRFSQSVSIKIPVHYFDICNNELSFRQVALINRYFEDRFEEEMCSYVINDVTRGFEKKVSIQNFCIFHNVELDTDISSDAIVKMEYRFRKNKLKKSTLNLSFLDFTNKEVQKIICPQ